MVDFALKRGLALFVGTIASKVCELNNSLETQRIWFIDSGMSSRVPEQTEWEHLAARYAAVLGRHVIPEWTRPAKQIIVPFVRIRTYGLLIAIPALGTPH
jgi:hypothetical protein